MEKQELKPCPFCGSTDIAIVKQDNPHNDYDGDYPHLYTAACKQCLSRSPQKVYEGYAAEAWNTRTSGWIPCSERMPENDVPVNIVWVNHKPESYYMHIKDKPFTATGVCHNGKWHWYSSVTVDVLQEYGRYRSEEIDKAIEILCWMPLPEPPEDC